MNLEEARRQLELAIHDARVAFDCIELEDLDRAQQHAIMARAAVDAAENVIRVAVEERDSRTPAEAEDAVAN